MARRGAPGPDRRRAGLPRRIRGPRHRGANRNRGARAPGPTPEPAVAGAARGGGRADRAARRRRIGGGGVLPGGERAARQCHARGAPRHVDLIAIVGARCLRPSRRRGVSTVARRPARTLGAHERAPGDGRIPRHRCRGVERERIRKPHPRHGARARRHDRGRCQYPRRRNRRRAPRPRPRVRTRSGRPQSARRGERRRPGRCSPVVGSHAAGRRTYRDRHINAVPPRGIRSRSRRAHLGTGSRSMWERVRSP